MQDFPMLFALNEHTTSAIDKKTVLNDGACLYKVTRVAKFQIESAKLVINHEILS